MKKLACCELSKNCFKRIEKIYQQESRDFGIKMKCEFQIYLAQMILIKKNVCFDCQDFQTWYKEYCERVRRKIQRKNQKWLKKEIKDDIDKKTSLAQVIKNYYIIIFTRRLIK